MIDITTILDLTIVGNCILYICSFYILSYLFDFNVKKIDIFSFIIYVIVTSISLLINENVYIPILLLCIYFVIRFKYKFLYIVLFYVIFFSYSSFMQNMSKHMIYRYYLVHVAKKEAFWVYIIPIINILVIKYICIIYKMMFKKNKYKYDILIDIDGKVKKCKGYYDSGNTLIYNSRPVIFYNGYIDGLDISYSVAGGSSSSKYVNGYVFVKKKRYSVYIASSTSSFNGCEVLLNALMV